MLILRAINFGRYKQKNNFIEVLTRASFFKYIPFYFSRYVKRLMFKISQVHNSYLKLIYSLLDSYQINKA